MALSNRKAFISHGSSDRAFVEHFASDLRANGVEAWYSGWEIKAGDSIRAKLDEGLAECDIFIIVLSKESIRRPWVQTELDAATVRMLDGKVQKIIPIKLDDCGDLPPTLAALLCEDFSRQDYQLALKGVLHSIFRFEHKPPLVLLCYKLLTTIEKRRWRYREVRMGVVKANIQTVEDMYRLIWTAIANRQPISAIYKELPRLFCPHRLGRNRLGQPRVLCYQYGGESESGLGPIGSPDNWRCVVFEKLRRVELLSGSWKTAPNHSRPATCVVDADIDVEDQPERDRDPQTGH